MIRRNWFSLLALLTIIACNNDEKATIKGTIENYDADKISYLEEIRVSGTRVIDSVSIRSNGKFRHNLNLKSTGIYQLRPGRDYSLAFIISPGEKVQLQADASDFYRTKSISGSPVSERVNVLHDSLRSTIALLDDIKASYAALTDSLSDKEARRQDLVNDFTRIRNDHHAYSVQFILDDLASLANIVTLYQEYAPSDFVFQETRDLQYFKLVSDTLTKYYPNLRHVKALQEYYSQLMSDYNRQRVMQSQKPVETDIPGINLPSLNGKEIALSSLSGKYVLLTFWSVDDAECIQNTLDLKEMYSKYKDLGFEIYQVSTDNSFEIFRKRVLFEELKWISVVDTGFAQSQTRYLYNVNSLPMNYLLNREQTEILAKNLSPEVLEQTLQYLFTQE